MIGPPDRQGPLVNIDPWGALAVAKLIAWRPVNGLATKVRLLFWQDLVHQLDATDARDRHRVYTTALQGLTHEEADAIRRAVWAQAPDGSLPFGSLFTPPETSGPAPGATVPPFLLTESADDEGNAQCVARLYADRFLHCDAYGWLQYSGRFWKRAGASASLDRAIVDVLKRRWAVAVQAQHKDILSCARLSARHVQDCRTLLRSILDVNLGEFDRDLDALNCANGVVDLRTGRLMPHQPSQRYTYCTPVDYLSGADCSEWLAFLDQVVGGGQEVLAYLQRAVGYTLTGHTREESLFYIFGPSRSGKGTFMETLLALMGGRLAKEVDFNTFTARRDNDASNFDLADLRPCRFIAAGESNKYQTLNTGKVKQLTGGDEVRCAFKSKDHFTYRPRYKIWLFSNHPLNADVDDAAIWYRVKVLEFPNSFVDREDKTLKQRLKSADALRGVLRWAVEGAGLWYAAGAAGLTAPGAVVSATRHQRERLDYVQQWLAECCEFVPDHFEPNQRLYQSYLSWCKMNGVEPKQQRGLSLSLKAKGVAVDQQKKIAGRNHKGAVGLKVAER
jgi:putative DNA primase/helicase